MKPYRVSTDEFVAGFTKPSHFIGDIAEMVGNGIMPNAVNRDDPRVKAIIARCQRNTKSRPQD